MELHRHGSLSGSSDLVELFASYLVIVSHEALRDYESKDKPLNAIIEPLKYEVVAK
jgi:hypothetical protein